MEGSEGVILEGLGQHEERESSVRSVWGREGQGEDEGSVRVRAGKGETKVGRERKEGREGK